MFGIQNRFLNANNICSYIKNIYLFICKLFKIVFPNIFCFQQTENVCKKIIFVFLDSVEHSEQMILICSQRWPILPNYFYERYSLIKRSMLPSAKFVGAFVINSQQYYYEKLTVVIFKALVLTFQCKSLPVWNPIN